MSARRNVGDWVYLKSNTGFICESHMFKAQIQDDGFEPCWGEPLVHCEDPECKEWATLWSEPLKNGEVVMLCHVSECQMFDEKQDK